MNAKSRPSAPTLTKESVSAAIHGVCEPCSLFNGTDLSLVDLGMVETINIHDGVVKVGLLLDDPTCLYAFMIQRDIREAVSQIVGVTAIEIELIADQIWTEDRMPLAAREKLQEYRQERRAHLRELARLTRPRTTRHDALVENQS